jgi:hypothetical protein
MHLRDSFLTEPMSLDMVKMTSWITSWQLCELTHATVAVISTVGLLVG